MKWLGEGRFTIRRYARISGIHNLWTSIGRAGFIFTV